MVEPLFGVHLSVAALILRIAIGSLFIVHGYPKLGAQQRKQGAEWMKSMGPPDLYPSQQITRKTS